tara:strand:- start:12888 stop:14039 length:1152 start_codon:yes stop_codon:yes gene_type:complete
MTRSRNNYKEELKNHYANDCDFESDSDNDCEKNCNKHWVPYGVMLQEADDNVLKAQCCAARAAKAADNCLRDAAVMVARRAAKAAEKAAQEVSMCGQLTLKELQVFSKKNDVKKYKEVYEGITKRENLESGHCGELQCEPLFTIFDFYLYMDYGDTLRDVRLEEMDKKKYTFTYRGCGCEEHFHIKSEEDLEKVYDAFENRWKNGRLHYYKYCEQTALAFKNKDVSNSLYKRYAKKCVPKWPPCPHCGAKHSTKAYHETHTLKCKYNINNPLQKNLIEVPIFEENESIVKDKIVLQYNFFKPVKVYVSKKDIRKVTNSETKNVVAYSLDSNHKPVQRYVIHQISKWRMPDNLKEDKSYPFKHAYAFTKEQSTPSDTLNWVVAV